MLITFELTHNLDELFSEIMADLQVKTMRDALRAAGQVVRAEMELRAPVNTENTPGGNSLAPGALKASISARLSRVSPEGVGSVTIGPSSKTSHVARWMEYGWILTSHRVSGKKPIRFIPPDPFIRPAYEASLSQALQAFEKTVRAGIRRVRT